MSTPPTSNLGQQNWYATTLSQSCGSTDTTLYLTVTPSVTEGYLVIDPNNTSTREVVHFTSVGAGTISIPTTGDRGLDGTSAQTHAQGTDIELHYTTSYFTALQSGEALSAGSITPTKLVNFITASANLAGGQTLSPSGSGTIVYSANNPTVTLLPGTYLLSGTASAVVTTGSQDMTFGIVINNTTTSTQLTSNAYTTLGIAGAINVFPSITTSYIVTISTTTQFTALASQTFGTSSTFKGVSVSLIPILL